MDTGCPSAGTYPLFPESSVTKERMGLEHIRKRHWVYLILLVLLTFLVFSNTLRNGFIWDDEELIVGNRFIKSLVNLPFIFTFNYWNNFHPATKGIYRPITTFTFALDYLFWQDDPRGYHLTNLLLHLANVILIYFLAAKLISQKFPSAGGGFLSAALLSAAFFAVHPIHTESVTWIKNRSDPLSLIFFLLAILLFDRHFSTDQRKSKNIAYAGSLFCFLLAVFSKETAITLPAVLILYAVCIFPSKDYSKAFFKTLPFLAITIFYLFLKKTALVSDFSPADTFPLSLYRHLLAVVKTLGYYAKLLVLPVNLNAERPFSIPNSFTERGVLWSLGFLVLILGVILMTFRRWRLISFAMLWVFLTLLPASNIVFLYGRPIAEQRLYIPSFGFCLLLGWGINRISSLQSRAVSQGRVKGLAAITCLLIIVFYSGATFRRNFDWQDSVSFWQKTAVSSSDSLRVRYNLGNAYFYQDRPEAAIEAYRSALKINPKDEQVYINLGVVHRALGDINEAIGAFKKAIEIKPQSQEAYFNLGAVYNGLGRQGEAIEAFKKSLEIDPKNAEAYNYLGSIYESMTKYTEAVDYYSRAIKINPLFAEAYHNLGTVYSNTGKFALAIGAYHKALEIKPDYALAYLNLAVAYYGQKDYPAAIRYCDKAAKLGYSVPPQFLMVLEPYRSPKTQ